MVFIPSRYEDLKSEFRERLKPIPELLEIVNEAFTSISTSGGIRFLPIFGESGSGKSCAALEITSHMPNCRVHIVPPDLVADRSQLENYVKMKQRGLNDSHLLILVIDQYEEQVALRGPIPSQFIEHLSLLDSYMNSVSKQKKTKLKTSPRIDVGTKILNDIGRMRHNQPEKAELLLLLNERLINKETLPTLKDIRFYLEHEQLPMTKASSRKNAVESLLMLFMDMKINELRGHLNNLPIISDNYQRSLSRWSDIISKKNINDNELPTIKF